MRNVYLVTLFVCVLGVSILGFRGTTFTAPPIDLFPDWAFPGMEVQPKHRLRPPTTSSPTAAPTAPLRRAPSPGGCCGTTTIFT